MQNPEIIFIFIAILIIAYLVFSVFFHKKTIKLILAKILISLFILVFSWFWFMPVEIAKKGESAVCKFRLQVFLCDWHDYGGYGGIDDYLFRLEPEKYGRLDFYDRIGGWQEYFGFKDID